MGRHNRKSKIPRRPRYGGNIPSSPVAEFGLLMGLALYVIERMENSIS